MRRMFRTSILMEAKRQKLSEAVAELLPTHKGGGGISCERREGVVAFIGPRALPSRFFFKFILFCH
jgi:hypothetical protein